MKSYLERHTEFLGEVLRDTGAVIAGGHAVRLYFLENQLPIYKDFDGDVDLYISSQAFNKHVEKFEGNLYFNGQLLTKMGEVGGSETKLDDNSIAQRYAIKNLKIDVIVLEKEFTTTSLLESFDLDICQVAVEFDHKKGHVVLRPSDKAIKAIKSRKITVSKNNRTIRKNAEQRARVVKYIERTGFLNVVCNLETGEV